ncbi:MAG TPA: TonB-dependent receptor [Gammaproteobacteria bacterium]|nr:TonB-dependent receptor [Gammaproteobacteria bacterium]
MNAESRREAASVAQGNLGQGRAPSRHFVRSAVAAAVACALSGSLASTANAQAQQPAQGPSPQIEEVTVTGTLIRASGMETPTPVTVVQAQELGNMAPGELIDALDKLPQFLNNTKPTTAASKADSAGASNLNMRAIGSKRTLVLLDGQRIVPSNRLGLVDINLFPEALLQRVETVTGGASAAYGTDAVAGVVNFVLNDNYTGFETHLQGGMTEHNDNKTYEFSAAGGTDVGERGHVIASFERFNADRIDNLNGRDWYKGIGTVTNTSGSGPRLLTRPNVVSSLYTPGGIIDAPGTSIDHLYFNDFGQPVPFVFGEDATTTTGTHNMVGGSGFNPTNYDLSISTPAFPHGTRSGSFVPDSERANGFVRFSYDVNDKVKVYADALIGDTKTDSVGTLPLGHSIWALTAYRDNPFLPAEIQQAMVDENIPSFKLQRYHTEADIAQDRFIMKNATRSYTAGFDWTLGGGGFFDGWSVQGYYQTGKNDNHLDFNDFNRTDRLPLAMDAVVDPSTGDIVCRVTLFSDAYDDCVPINLFGRGRASQAAIDWVNGDMDVDARVKQDNAQFSASGEAFDGWAGPISLAFGVSWREQSIHHRIGPADLANQAPLANDAAQGIRGIPLAWLGTNDRLSFVDLDNYDGSFDVKEIFAESLIPLVSDKPFVKQLNLSLAARLADYEGSGNITANKVGLDWRVNDTWRVRTTVSRDVRAASLEERFDRQGQGTSVDDPLLANRYTTFQLRGGNPNVSPEVADTVTLGAVFQPRNIEGLSMSLDWYDIDMSDSIDFIGVQEIVDQCFDTGSAAFCNRVHRDPATQIITLVENTFANVNKRAVSGVDLEVDYTRPINLFTTGAESLSWRFLASRLNENSTTVAGAPKRDLVGEVGLAGLPELQMTTNVTYRNGPFGLFLQGRWIDSGVADIDYVEGVDIDDNSVESVFYTDLRASYTGKFGQDGEWEAFLHVANLTDKDPPLVPGWSDFGGTGIGTNENLYDVLGRRFTVGFRLRY